MPTKRKRLPRREERVEISFLEAVRRRFPKDEKVLEALGDLYTRTGRFQEGLDADLELVRQRPQECMVWYNLACSYSLTGRSDESFQALHRAIELGYRDFQWMLRDKDLEQIRGDQRFSALLKKILPIQA